MSPRSRPVRHWPGSDGPRVGFFGILGSGNIGNDGSLDATLAALRVRHPNARLDFLCSGPEEIRRRYGGPATRLHWFHARPWPVGGVGGRALTALLVAVGLGVDTVRTAAWVRRQDLVVVPGMGVLESTLPLRPWQTPTALFLLCASGRVLRTPVALVGVGASPIRERLSRWLVTSAARLARYRSYRDEASRAVMQTMGVPAAADPVHPDVAFALPTPPPQPALAGLVGLGVMSYYGSGVDRHRAEQVHDAYLTKVLEFLLWLVDSGYDVLLLTGDDLDNAAVERLMSGLAERRPGLAPGRVRQPPAGSLQELMQSLAAVETVVASRFHNVVCALMMGKPVISLGYGAKNEVLLSDMGLVGNRQPIAEFDVDVLITQFKHLSATRADVVPDLLARVARASQQVDSHLANLFDTLLPAGSTGSGNRAATPGVGRVSQAPPPR